VAVYVPGGRIGGSPGRDVANVVGLTSGSAVLFCPLALPFLGVGPDEEVDGGWMVKVVDCPRVLASSRTYHSSFRASLHVHQHSLLDDQDCFVRPRPLCELT